MSIRCNKCQCLTVVNIARRHKMGRDYEERLCWGGGGDDRSESLFQMNLIEDEDK